MTEETTQGLKINKPLVFCLELYGKILSVPNIEHTNIYQKAKSGSEHILDNLENIKIDSQINTVLIQEDELKILPNLHFSVINLLNYIESGVLGLSKRTPSFIPLDIQSCEDISFLFLTEFTNLSASNDILWKSTINALSLLAFEDSIEENMTFKFPFVLYTQSEIDEIMTNMLTDEARKTFETYLPLFTAKE